MGVRFNKNVFFANETAVADLSVDNSQAQVAAVEIDFQVVQRIRIGLNQPYRGKYDVIQSVDRNPIPAGTAEAQKR